MIGFAHIMAALTHQRPHAVTHLRSVNPHLTSILSSVSPRSKPPAFPRQDSPAPLTTCGHAGPEAAIQGLSSFAFQGTNAHAVLCKGGSIISASASDAAHTGASIWKRSRVWYTAATHTLLQHVSVSSSMQGLEARFVNETTRSSLAYLMDHQIKGRVLLPGAAMFEMAASAAATLLGNSSDERQLAVLHIGLSVPLVLVPGIVSTLMCTVACATGQLYLRSAASSAAAGQQLHATATAGTSRLADQSAILHCCFATCAGMMQQNIDYLAIFQIVGIMSCVGTHTGYFCMQVCCNCRLELYPMCSPEQRWHI